MKLNVGAVLAIALLVVGAVYSLNRGAFVGSELKYDGQYYHLVCSYLFPSGVRDVDTGGWGSPEDAKVNRHCTVFFK